MRFLRFFSSLLIVCFITSTFVVAEKAPDGKEGLVLHPWFRYAFCYLTFSLGCVWWRKKGLIRGLLPVLVIFAGILLHLLLGARSPFTGLTLAGVTAVCWWFVNRRFPEEAGKGR